MHFKKFAKTIKSQIMLTTLLSISILIIFITTIIFILRNDIQQVFYTSRYNEYYLASDSIISKLTNDISSVQEFDTAFIIDSIKDFVSAEDFNDLNNSITCSAINGYNLCSGTISPQKLINNQNIITQFQIQEVNYLSDYELLADEIFQFKIYRSGINDFRGKVDFIINQGSSNGLIEIGVLGRDNREYVRMWRDFIDFASLSSTPKSKNILPISNLQTDTSTGDISFTLDLSLNIADLDRDSLFLTDIILVPRLSSSSFVESPKLSINLKNISFRDYSAGYDLPPIAIEISVLTRNINSQDSSVILKSRIPYLNQSLSIFDYVLFSEEDVIIE